MAKSASNAKTTKNCIQCGKPGGRVQPDPYQLDVDNKVVQVRLHADCANQRAADI